MSEEVEREPETAEGETDEEQVAEFANKFTLRRVVREAALGYVLVTVVYNNDSRPSRPREYEYYIPFDEYEYDKIKIARHIRQQHRERGGSDSRKK